MSLIEAVEGPSRASADRRRFVVGCVIGAVLAVAVFAWLITAGNAHLPVRQTFGSDFYDAQATALLHGHWDMPARVLGIDGFRVGSKYYMYFGVWPSLLRMPALALSDSLSGHLTIPSMVVAFVVLVGGAGALLWRIRSLVRPEHPCSRGEAVIAGAAVFVIGCGSTALFLGSRTIVYHEAILWAAAWSLLAYERIIAFTQRPSRSRLGVAALFTTLSILSRVSIGIGPVIAIALLAAIELMRIIVRWRASRTGRADAWPLVGRLERAGVREGGERGWFLATAVAAVVPFVAYAWMNFSRFGSFFGIPWRSQVIAQLSREHRAMLDANGGSLFGLDLIPTTLLQAVRPDALGPSPVFPWVTFQRFPTPVIGDAVFNKLDFTTSVTASMPALVVLGVIGVVATVWTRIGRSRDLSALRAPLVGAGIAAAVSLAFTFVAARYLGDWLPLLAIAAFAGLEVLLVRRHDAPRRGRWNVAIGVVALLAVFGIWVNFSLGVLYQRLYSPPNPTMQAEMLAFQYRVAGRLGAGTPDLVVSPRLPSRIEPAGTTWIVGECRALYWSDGRSWIPVEGDPSGGWVRLRVDLEHAPMGWSPLVGFGFPGRQDVVGVFGEPGAVRFGLGRPDATGQLVWRTGVTATPRRPGLRRVDVLADRVNHALFVTVSGRYLLSFSDAPTSPAPADVVRGPVEIGSVTTGGLAPFPARIQPLPPEVRYCQRMRELAGEA